MHKSHKMSTVHEDKLNTQLDQPTSSPFNLTMATTPERQPTDKDSESSLPKQPVESSSGDAKETLKEDSSVSNITDDENADSITGKGGGSKRFLPAYKKANAALTFPEKVRNFNLEGRVTNLLPKLIVSDLVLCFVTEDDELDEICGREEQDRKGVLCFLAS